MAANEQKTQVGQKRKERSKLLIIITTLVYVARHSEGHFIYHLFNHHNTTSIIESFQILQMWKTEKQRFKNSPKIT